MARLPLPNRDDPTLDAVEVAVENTHRSDVRNYLGWSGLQHPCERSVQYDFLWASSKTFRASTLFKFEDGHGTEDRVNGRLALLPPPVIDDDDNLISGVQFLPLGPDGHQWSVSSLGGHLRGHLDGIIRGLLQAPKTWHVYEVKCVAEAKFRKLKRLVEEHGKDALEHWDEQYFIQAQGYMGAAEPQLKRHYLICVTPGGREMTSVRTDFQPKAYQYALDKAARLITHDELSPRISEDPDFYVCKHFCSFKDVCHAPQVSAKVSCRTCAHSTPIIDDAANNFAKRWKCELHDNMLSTDDQKRACPQHLYRPDMLGWAQPHQFNKLDNEIEYRTDNGKEFINCEKADWKNKRFTSKDLQHLNAETLETDSSYLDALSKFCPSAEIESRKKKVKPDELELNDDLPTWM